MKYPIDWNSDKEIRKLYSYQARIGIAPKFGSRPIGWYQIHQDKAYECIMDWIRGMGFDKATVKTSKNGVIWINNHAATNVNAVYDAADKLVRQ